MGWQHAWVLAGDSIVDGNADSIRENPIVGSGVVMNPFWGPLDSLPVDRRFAEGQLLSDAERNDPDVVGHWWPRLEAWLREEGFISSSPTVAEVVA